MTLKSEIQIGRSRFLKNYTISYKSYGNLMGILLPDVVDTFLNTSLVNLLVHSETSIDIKGASSGSNNSNTKEEILKVHGKVILPGNKNTSSKNYQKGDFSVSLGSSLKGFRENKHIEFGIEEKRSGLIPQSVYLNKIGRVIPVELEIATATLEFLKPKKIFGLGVSPTLISVFRLFATRERVGFEIDIMNSSHLDLTPPTLHEFIKELSDKLEPNIHFNIFQDFYKSIQG